VSSKARDACNSLKTAIRTSGRRRTLRANPYPNFDARSVSSSRKCYSSSAIELQDPSPSVIRSEHGNSSPVISKSDNSRVDGGENDSKFGKTLPIPAHFTYEQRAELYEIQMEQAEDKRMMHFYHGTRLAILFRKIPAKFKDGADDGA
jgi:hypothetical protein